MELSARGDSIDAGGEETAWGRPELISNINFRRHRKQLIHGETSDIFRYIYEHNHWGSPESVSGEGSEVSATVRLRSEVPAMLRRWEIRSIVDVPCGDFGWLGSTELGVDSYFGGDIVPELVERNRRCAGGSSRRFEVIDLASDPLPEADLVLSRDCLVHFSYDLLFSALRNIRASGARFLLTTTFPELALNVDTVTGDWRPLNFQLPPFGFPEPIDQIVEGCLEANGSYADKTLGLWEVAAIDSLF